MLCHRRPGRPSEQSSHVAAAFESPPRDLFAFEEFVSDRSSVSASVSISESRASHLPSSSTQPELHRPSYSAPGLIVPDDRLHVDQIDHAVELIFCPIGSWMATAFGAEAFADGVDRMSKSAPMRSILLMKQMRGTSYLSAWRQTVSDCGCTPSNRVEHRDSAVEHAQRRSTSSGEVHVTGRVDDVDAMPSRSRLLPRR